MSCSRATQIDLLGFLQEPRAANFDEFRLHYPACADCAREVAAWTELEGWLGALADTSAHPAPHELDRFESRDPSFAPDARRRIETHLEGCVACRDELRALRAFTPPAAAPRAVATAAPVAPPRGRFTRWIANPALAWGVAALLAVPLVYDALPGIDPPWAGGRTAETATAPTPSEAAPEVAEIEGERPRARADAIEAESRRSEPVTPGAGRMQSGLREEAPGSPAAASGSALGLGGRSAADLDARLERDASRPTTRRLRSDAPTEIAHALADAPLRLIVPRPPGPAGVVSIRLADATGERVLPGALVPTPDDALGLDLPAGFLRVGESRIEVSVPGADAPIGYRVIVLP